MGLGTDKSNLTTAYLDSPLSRPRNVSAARWTSNGDIRSTYQGVKSCPNATTLQPLPTFTPSLPGIPIPRVTLSSAGALLLFRFRCVSQITTQSVMILSSQAEGV